ncbi:MAG: hypothetical protein K0S12_1210, partial [Bacteroidetes bacterium]|nr:hypothetical protein [Bacteroidota bacterium]
WCTSLKSDVVTAYNTVIKDFIHENEDALIVIRCHPQIDLKNFIKNDLVKADFDRYFTFSSKKDILDDIAAADIVLAVSGSTVFLDALVAKKPVFHIVNNDYYMGSLGQNEMTHITSSKEMSLAFRNYKNGKIFASAASGLLTLDEDKWVTLLSKN